MRFVAACLCACALAMSSAVAHAGPVIIYSGQDLGAGPNSPRPNASAAEAAWTAAAKKIGKGGGLTFENTSVGTFTGLAFGQGVSLQGKNYLGQNQSILNSPAYPAAPSLDGFNINSGGSNFVELRGGYVTFTFETPIQFFGLYITGAQNTFYQDSINFFDGALQSINVPEFGTSDTVGALAFVGFTDESKSISSVTIQASEPGSGADFIGIDNVLYQNGPLPAAAVTPEPSSLALLGTGLAALAGIVRRRPVA